MLVKIPWMEVVVFTSELKLWIYDHNKSVVEVYVVKIRSLPLFRKRKIRR